MRPLRALILSPLLAAGMSLHLHAQNSPARPGDRVLLRIMRDSVYSDTLRIDPNGMVVIPLAGDVRLGDITGNALQDTVRAHLSRYVTPSAVQVELLRRVRVVGAVAKPGVYYVDRTFTVRDAVAGAGGVSEIGYEKRAVLDRGGTQRAMKDWTTGADGALFVESGDQITVGRLPWYQRNALTVVSGLSVFLSIVIALRR